LFHTDRQTDRKMDRHAEANNDFSQFWNAQKKQSLLGSYRVYVPMTSISDIRQTFLWKHCDTN